VSVDVHNYLSPVTTPLYTLSTTSPWINITDNAHNGGSLADDGSATLANAFAFTVNADAPPGTKLDLRLDITAAGYADFQYLPIVLEPLFETHDVNRLHVSLTATGGIGWVGFPSGLGDEGHGFVFDGSPNVLFEGALLLGTGPTALSDAARIGNEHTDFACALHDAPTIEMPGDRAAQEIHAGFTDAPNTTTPLGVSVEMTSFASASPPNDDFVVVQYDITNATTAPFDSLYAGLFFDWDIDESRYATNQTAYDAGRRLGYAWDQDPSLPYTGVVLLSGGAAGFSAIRNNGPGLALIDGFSKAEKWDVLQGGTGVLSAGPTDISNALSSGPYTVPVGATRTVVFGLLGAADLPGLQVAADRCATWFADSITTDVADPVDPPGPDAAQPPRPSVWIGAAHPNPFNPGTRIELDVRTEREVEVAVFDARGRHVATLARGRHAAGRTVLEWDGTDAIGVRVASGVYIVRLRSGGVVQTRRIVLAK
jgi:hypothetical protein